jgi:hypothetical protein
MKLKLNKPWKHPIAIALCGRSGLERYYSAVRIADYYYREGLPLDGVISMLASWNLYNKPPIKHEHLISIVESAEWWSNKYKGIYRGKRIYIRKR